MVKNCCVSTCKTVWNPYDEFSLFSFPWKNDALLQEWIKVIPTNRKITAHSRICSLHFTNESVEQKFGKRILKKDAIPTIFAAQGRTVQDSSCLSPSRLTSPTTTQNEDNEVVGNHSGLQREVEMKSVGTQISPRRLKPSTREVDLQRKVKILQVQLRRREKRLLTMSQLIKKLKQSDLNIAIKEEQEELNSDEEETFCIEEISHGNQEREKPDNNELYSEKELGTYCDYKNVLKEIKEESIDETKFIVKEDFQNESRRHEIDFIKCENNEELHSEVLIKEEEEQFSGENEDVSNSTEVANEKPYKCDKCGKGFKQKGYLKIHAVLHTGDRPFKCNICEKSFNLQVTLKRHAMIHSGDKPHKCDKCKKSFVQRALLIRHSKLHTDPYKCNKCNESFNDQKALKQHAKIHPIEKPFTCDVCEKSYSHKKSLKDHMAIHTGEKPFKCDLCEKSFILKKSLTEHTKIHTEETPYKCDICEKSFKQKAFLRKHALIHSQAKPFKCDTCGRCFVHRQTLMRHTRIHTREKPFACDRCGKCFNRRETFNYHVKIHTREKVSIQTKIISTTQY